MAATTAPSRPRTSGRGRFDGATRSLGGITRPEIRRDIEVDREAASVLLFVARRQPDVLEDDEFRSGLERVDEPAHVAIVAGQRVGCRQLRERAALLALHGVAAVLEFYVRQLRELREPRVGEAAREALVRRQHVLVELLQRGVRLLLARDGRLRRRIVLPRLVQLFV